MNSKHTPLIIAISLPFIFIFIISIVLFAPSLSIRPKHNFIYTSESTYYAYETRLGNTYVVKNDRIVSEQLPAGSNSVATTKVISPTLYLYDVVNDSSHQISFETAAEYKLDPGPSSPDGYTVSYQYSHSGIFELFGSNSSRNGYVISKKNGKKSLEGLMGDRYSGQGNFKLIGWVK